MDLPEEVSPESQPEPFSLESQEIRPTKILPLRLALEGPEREILVSALLQTKGCRKTTSEALAINRTTLFNKMRKYGLMELDFNNMTSATPPTPAHNSPARDRS